MNQPLRWVRAYAMLRGSSKSAGAADAGRRLQSLGFKVTRSNPLAITLEGPPELFAEVFHAKFAPEVGSARKSLARETGFTQTPWRFQVQPRLPEELRSQISDIVLPPAAALHR